MFKDIFVTYLCLIIIKLCTIKILRSFGKHNKILDRKCKNIPNKFKNYYLLYIVYIYIHTRTYTINYCRDYKYHISIKINTSALQ